MSRILLWSLKHSYLKLNYTSLAVQNKVFWKSTLPCANCLFLQRNCATAAAQALENIDSKISRLDQIVKRVGRTTLKEVQSALNEIQIAGMVSVTQSLMMIRSSGSLLAEVKPEIRTNLVHKIWKILEDLNVKLDISHYNALLRVYLENDYAFAPSDILAEISKQGLEPNRVTFQRLIARYCQMGDLEGATRILRFMREEGMPINETVFNSLISGHAQLNEMENAEGILSVMKAGNIEPSSDTYTQLICGYIKNGMITEVDEIFKKCKNMEITFSDKNYFDIIYAYAMNDYEEEVNRVLNMIRRTPSYNHDAMNFILKLLTANKLEVGYKVLKSMVRTSRSDGSVLPVGNFFIAYLINNDMPSEEVIKYTLDLMNEHLNPRSLAIGVDSALRGGKERLTLDLLRLAKDDNIIPIRQHYFWPLLVHRGKQGDTAGMVNILRIMYREFDLQLSHETVRDYVIPYMLKNGESISKLLLYLKGCGMPTNFSAGNVVCHLLDEGKLHEAAEVANDYITAYVPWVDISMNLHYVSAYRAVEDHRVFIGEILERVINQLVTVDKNVVETLLKKLVGAKVGLSEEKVKSIQSLVSGVVSPKTVASLEKLASDELATPTMKTKPIKLALDSLDYETLEHLYELSKSKGEEPHVNLKRLLLTAYAKAKELEKMEKMRKELEAENYVLSTALKSYLLDAYTHHNKIQEAMQIYESLNDDDINFQLNPIKTINLASMLVQNGECEKAKEVLQKLAPLDGKEGVDVKNAAIRNNVAVRFLNKLADNGDAEKVHEFFNLLTSWKIIDVNNLTLGPLIRVHLKRGDYDTAINKFEKCVQQYKATPLNYELCRTLIEKEDATNLQKLTDLSTQVHGKVNMFCDLMTIYLDCGRTKQARKIFEEPGFRLNDDRLKVMCNHFEKMGHVESLNNLLKVTKDAAFIDRSYIYNKLFMIYLKQNDAQSALALWMKIQEEDIQPSDSFLNSLAELLERNNMPIPFAVPKHLTRTSSGSPSSEHYKSRKTIKPVPHSDKIEDTLPLQKKPDSTKGYYTRLVKTMLEENRYSEAKELVTELLNKDGFKIRISVLKQFLKRASQNDDVDLFVKMSDKLTDALKKKITFNYYLRLVPLAAGRVEEFLRQWENDLAQIKDKGQLNKHLVSIPLGNVLKIMSKNPEFFERVKAIAEKCFEIDPKNVMGNIIWSHYMLQKEYDKADEMFDKYLKNAEKLRLTVVLEHIQATTDVELGKKLLSMLRKGTTVSKNEFALAYGCLIDICVQRNEIEDAKTWLQEAITELPLEDLSYSVLKTLKTACLNKKIPFEYELPEKGEEKNRSNTDSDSD